MIFISHSSKDKAAALDVQQRLLKYGYDASQIFLDSDAETGIPAGSKWEQVLYARLKDCRALIVLCSAHWQKSKWCFAELVFAKAMGKEIFPILLQKRSIDLVAAEHQAVFVYKEGETAYERLWKVLDNRHLGPGESFPWPAEACPFPGLPAFDERFAGVYFGREAETQTILEDLRKMRATGEPRFLMIVGGSGSGKSSLLKAGVLPRLKHKILDTEWVILPTLRYGEQANEQRTVFDQLAVSIAELFPENWKSMPDWKLLRKQLINDDIKHAVRAFVETLQDLTLARNRSPQATPFLTASIPVVAAPSPQATTPLEILAAMVNAITKRRDRTVRRNLVTWPSAKTRIPLAPTTPADATVLIVIDQFEELLAPSAEPTAAKFLTFLSELLNCRNGQVLAIGTMRSDHLDIYEQSTDALRAPYFYPWRLGPFPPERIEDVIRKPAKRAGLEITDELVERLKHDTPTAEALPLLAFTLEKLYRGYASDGRLELQDYESLGGMEGSIQKCVERIVPPNSLPASEAAALRLTFVKHLAQVNDKGEVVRLTARWDDLPAPAKPILEKFVNERLLIRSGNQDEGKPGQGSVSVEVAHEAMFRCWNDLKGWLHTSADILRWRRDVRHDQANDRKWTGLRPAQLAVARDWPKRRRDELTAEEIDWINRGIRWEWIRRGIVATVVLVIAFFGITAWWQRNEAKRQGAIAQENANKERIARTAAEEQARIAESRRLAAVSASALTNHPQHSLLLAVEAVKVLQPHGVRAPEAEQSLRVALGVIGGRLVARADGSITALAISSDGHWLVTGSGDNMARVWDLSAKDPAANPVVLGGHGGPGDDVAAVAISADNRWIVTGSWDKTARLWNLGAKDPAANPVVLGGHEDKVRVVAISADSRWVVTGSDDKTARLWDLSAKDPAANPVVLRGHEGRLWAWAISAVAISADSRWLVTGGGADHTARLWDLRAKDPAANPVVLRGHDGAVNAVAISADNRWVVTGSDDHTARLWDLSAKDPAANPVVLRGHDGPIRAVAISADSRWVVTGSDDKTARLWDLRAKDPAANPVVLRGHDAAVDSVAISADNCWVVTGSFDSTARLWDLRAKDPAANPVVLRGHESPVTAVAISADSRRIVTGSDNTARLFFLQLNDLINLARTIVGRNFYGDEWKLYFPGEKYRKTFPDLPGPD
jgi:WD40 repeat protein